MDQRVYLDWNATAPLRVEARDAMVEAFALVGNPSSVHAEGRAAKGIVERARAQVAALVGCAPAEIIFTSGATEAAALALPEGAVLSASAVEHDAVASWVGEHAWLDVDSLGQLIGTDIGQSDVVAVQAANSETGVMQSLENRVAAARESGALVLVDAVQAVGKVPFSFAWSGTDMAMVSAHKLGGPKGVGALILRQGIDVSAKSKGGGQEMGRRSGTENVAGIAGFGAACAAALDDLNQDIWSRVEELRNILETTLAAGAKETIFVGQEAKRLPNTSCFAVPGWKGETQVMQMDLAGFAISAGSACSSGKVRESRVLLAMGHSPEVARSAIRVSLGPTTTRDDISRFADAWLAQYEKFRRRAA